MYMDGLKFQKWREEFTTMAKKVQGENKAVFLDRNIDEFYELTVDEAGETLCLEFNKRETLPEEIQDNLKNILITTRPEDSV